MCFLNFWWHVHFNSYKPNLIYTCHLYLLFTSLHTGHIDQEYIVKLSIIHTECKKTYLALIAFIAFIALIASIPS